MMTNRIENYLDELFPEPKCELIYKGDVKPEDGCYITYCGKKYYESKKDDTVDYLIIEDNTIYLKDLEQNVINKINF